MNIAASCSMLSCAVEYQGKFQPRRPQPFGAAGKWGTDPAQTLRDKVTKAVALLSALPVADPADRYSVRNLTVLWLQADKSELTRRAYYADLAGLARLVPAHRSGSTGSSPCRRGRLEGEHDGDRPGRALRRAASSSIAHKLATLSNWYHHQRDGCGPTPHNEREEMLAPRCVILVAMAETARQRARASLRVHVPELVNVAVLELGHGLDNTAFVVGDLVLRVTDARSVIREARLLKMIAPRVSIPVPAPRFVDENGGVLAYPLLPGRPLLGHRPPPGSAIRLGQFLRELHGIDPAVVASLIPSEDANPDEWLEGLDGPSDLIGLLHATVPPPAGQRVVAHADLGAEHVLELEDTSPLSSIGQTPRSPTRRWTSPGCTGTSARPSSPRRSTPTAVSSMLREPWRGSSSSHDARHWRTSPTAETAAAASTRTPPSAASPGCSGAPDEEPHRYPTVDPIMSIMSPKG